MGEIRPWIDARHPRGRGTRIVVKRSTTPRFERSTLGCDSRSPQITPLPLNSMDIEFFLEQYSKPMLFYILSISWFIYKKNSYDSLFVFVITNVQEEYNLCRMITKVQVEPNCELSSLISSLLTLWHWKTLVKLSCNARYISIKEKIKK